MIISGCLLVIYISFDLYAFFYVFCNKQISLFNQKKKKKKDFRNCKKSLIAPEKKKLIAKQMH